MEFEAFRKLCRYHKNRKHYSLNTLKSVVLRHFHRSIIVYKQSEFFPVEWYIEIILTSKSMLLTISLRTEMCDSRDPFWMLWTQSGVQIFSELLISPITGGLENRQFIVTPSTSESPNSLWKNKNPILFWFSVR